MKILNNEQVNAVNGAGFWSDLGDRIRDWVRSEPKEEREPQGISLYDEDNFKVEVGGANLAGGKGFGGSIRVKYEW